ncbi:hypothetical protein ACFL3C_04350 [Patescibacteria group bacterium]
MEKDISVNKKNNRSPFAIQLTNELTPTREETRTVSLAEEKHISQDTLNQNNNIKTY